MREKVKKENIEIKSIEKDRRKKKLMKTHKKEKVIRIHGDKK